MGVCRKINKTLRNVKCTLLVLVASTELLNQPSIKILNPTYFCSRVYLIIHTCIAQNKMCVPIAYYMFLEWSILTPKN